MSLEIQDTTHLSVLRTLGVGATSEVLAVEQDGRRWALKLFNPFVTAEPDILKRIVDEVVLLERLVHPNVVQVLGVRHHQGRFALDLELVEGQNLRDWQESRMAEADADLLETRLFILRQTARGLGAAHEQLILHRDLKPENVLISKKGEVKLTDFGLARSIDRYTFTRSGFLVGSLGYMAPEVLSGKRADERADLFSFGVMAYELLAGENPFPIDSPQALLMAAAAGNFVPLAERLPHISSDLGKLVDTCLNPNPALRPANIWEVEARLTSVISASGVLKWAGILLNENARTAALPGALRDKYQRLRTDLESSDRHCQLRAWSELRRLFPDDELSSRPPAPTRPTKAKHSAIARWSLVVGLTGLVLLATLFPRRIRDVHVPQLIPRAAAVVTPKAGEKKVTAKAVEKSVTPTVAQRFGYLHFSVPEQVSISVNGVAVGRAEMSRFAVLPGKHSVKMELPGYLPIENQVTVRAGRVTTVNSEPTP